MACGCKKKKLAAAKLNPPVPVAPKTVTNIIVVDGEVKVDPNPPMVLSAPAPHPGEDNIENIIDNLNKILKPKI